MFEAAGILKSMLNQVHIKQMLDRYDAFDVTSKSIRCESTLSVTNSSQVLSICMS